MLWTKTKGLARVTPGERERERERQRDRGAQGEKQAPTQMILRTEKEVEKVPRWSRSRPKMAGRFEALKAQGLKHAERAGGTYESF